MKKINILVDLQLSVLTSLNDGDFIFNTDSNVNAASFTIKGLLEVNPNYEIYLLIPLRDEIVNFGHFFEDSRIHLIQYPYFGNPFVERVSFVPRTLLESLKDITIDILYLNDPSKVLTYKTFFYMKQNEFIKIICRNHWVTGKLHRKVPEQIDFITRQVEGVLYSDYSTFNSKTAIDMLLENAKEFFNDETVAKLKSKCIATETVDAKKIDKYKKNKGNIITKFLFAHRLSYYTGWEEVLDVMNEMYVEGYSFKLFMPDPGNKKSQKELHLQYPFIVEINKDDWTHEDYLKLCWKADVAIGNHNIPTTWGGLSLTEPMVAECAPCMPRKDAYLEMFYQDASVYFRNRDELKLLLIRYIIDNKFLKDKQEEARKFCLEELSMSKYITTIDNLMQICLKQNSK